MGMKMLFTPLDGIVVIAFYIGISMLLSGVSEIPLYFTSKPEQAFRLDAGGTLARDSFGNMGRLR